MPISEIIDRYTITKLKDERTDENVTDELLAYKNEIDQYSTNLDISEKHNFSKGEEVIMFIRPESIFISDKSNKLEKVEFLKGMGVSALASVIFTAIGMHVILELVIFLCLMKLLKKKTITSKYIQNQLFQLAAQTQSLCKLMVLNALQYDKINKGYRDIIINSEALIAGNEALIRDSQSKLSKRENILEQIKKMK